MVQVVPVNLRNSSSGSRWYARGLTYSLSGRGKTPEEALAELKSAVEQMFPGDAVELQIRGVNITFPRSLSANDFSDWLQERSSTVM